MPVWLLGVLPFLVGFVLVRVLSLFVAVGVSTGLILLLYNTMIDYVNEAAANSYSVYMLNILGLMGFGEFIGIMFGAFIASAILRRVMPFIP